MCGARVRGEGATFLLAFTQMEKYSKHLEVLVAERTQELIAEQKKTDSLLYSESHLNHAGEVVVGVVFTVRGWHSLCTSTSRYVATASC